MPLLLEKNEFKNQSWNKVAITQALELDLHVTCNKVLTLPSKALEFSRVVNKEGLEFQVSLC
jgi:hypothetical protein